MIDSTWSRPEWHDPRFMEGDSIEAKERWLDCLIRRSSPSSVSVKEDPGTSSWRYDDHPTRHVAPDVEAYNVVIKGWAIESSINKAAAFRAEEWLLRLRQECVKEHQNKDQPGEYCEDDISAPGTQTKRDDQSSSGRYISSVNSRLRPNVESYNAALEAWSKSGESIAVVRAERWLNELRDLSFPVCACSTEDSTEMGQVRSSVVLDTRLGPTTESYNFFLSTCAKGLGKTKDALEENALKAERTLRYMLLQWEKHGNFRIAPNTESFNHVMTAITRCKSYPTVASRVMEWLRMMEGIQRSSISCADSDSSAENTTAFAFDVSPNTKSYTIAINAWGIVAQQKAQAAVKERRRERTLRGEQLDKKRVDRATLNEHSRQISFCSDGFDEAQKAEAILEYMHDLFDAGSTEVLPDTFAYNSVIGAWSKISSEYNVDAPRRAEEILREMIELFESGSPQVIPDNYSYTQVCKVFFHFILELLFLLITFFLLDILELHRFLLLRDRSSMLGQKYGAHSLQNEQNGGYGKCGMHIMMYQ